MIIIGLAGKAESGKTTFAGLLKGQFENIGKRVLFINYADYVKFIAEKYYKWNGKKDEFGRHLLQQIGTEKGRKLVNENLWVDMVIDTVQLAQYDFDVTIIGDCRFPNEFNRWTQRGGHIIKVLIERPNYENHLTEAQRKHLSEVALDNYNDWDITVVNSGNLSDFMKTAKTLVAKITNELTQITNLQNN